MSRYISSTPENEKYVVFAEALFDDLIGAKDGLILSDRVDIFTSDDSTGNMFYLRSLNPTEITNLNGSSLGVQGTDYTLIGRELVLKNGVALTTVFPFQYIVNYKAGWVTGAIPQDIQLAVTYLANSLENRSKSEGVASYKMDLLSISYDTAGGVLENIADPTEKNFIRLIVNKYSSFLTY